jgi:fructokinase
MVGKILSMGEALVDVLPAESGLWRPVAGGSSFNVALALGRLAAPAGFAGRFSGDEQGQALLSTLKSVGVATDLVSIDDRPSPLSLISRGTETTSARYSIYLEGTAHDPPGLPADWLDDIAHLHVSSFSAISGAWGVAVAAALDAARRRATTSFDINIRPALIPQREQACALIESRAKQSDVVKASDDDLAWLFPDRAPRDSAALWAKRFSCLVLLTRGAEGATAFGPFDPISAAAPAVDVVDTVGAGDAFMAAFLARAQTAGHLGARRPFEPAELARWLDFANHAAALCCARAGADPPTRKEVETFRASSSSQKA